MKFRLTSKQGFSRLTRGLVRLMSPQAVAREILYPEARNLLSDAQRVAPTDDGSLVASAHLAVDPTKAVVRYGFRAPYAAFQDGAPALARGKRKYEIRPRVKKALYVPTSRRGRRLHRYGNNPSREGLTWGEDYVLKQRVVIPLKRYGSSLGPNLYLTGTIRKGWPEVRKRIQAGVRKRFLRFKLR